MVWKSSYFYPTVTKSFIFLVFFLLSQDPNDNSMLDMLIGYSSVQIRILLLLLFLLLLSPSCDRNFTLDIGVLPKS